jgi:hypothetical protein
MGNNATANPTQGGKAENTTHRRSNWGANPGEGGEKWGTTKKMKEKKSRQKQSRKMEAALKTGNIYLWR